MPGAPDAVFTSGALTFLPRPNRDELIEIRKGKYSLSQIQQLGAQLESAAPLNQ
jgi:hypothetical protein